MAPNLLGSTTLLLAEVNQEPVKIKDTKPLVKSISTASPQAATHTASQASSKKKDDEYEWKIVWRNVLGFIYLHIGAVYGLYLFFVHARWLTLLFGVLYGMVAALGVTAGAHRLWAHRSYKATWQLRLILIILQTICFQNHIYEWVRDHRVHHKFTDSDADPHNSKRGFFFSHMGWLMIKKHKDVKEKGRIVDLSDLEKDPLVIWQRRLYLILMPVFCFVIPTLIPWYYWNEDLYTSWYVCAIFRYVLSLHFTWLVNSAAHIYGNRPYDESHLPSSCVEETGLPRPSSHVQIGSHVHAARGGHHELGKRTDGWGVAFGSWSGTLHREQIQWASSDSPHKYSSASYCLPCHYR